MPCRCSVAPRIGERLLSFGGVVDQDEIGTAPGQHPAGRGGQPVALTSGDKLLHGVAVRRQAGWEDPLEPAAHHVHEELLPLPSTDGTLQLKVSVEPGLYRAERRFLRLCATDRSLFEYRGRHAAGAPRRSRYTRRIYEAVRAVCAAASARTLKDLQRSAGAGPGSLMTRCWRRESGANPSQKMGFRPILALKKRDRRA